MYYVYVLKSEKDGTTYIGYTGNLEKRLAQHNNGETRSLKKKVPLKLVYFEQYDSKSNAIKREIKLKNNSWEKEQLYKKIFPQ